MRFVTGLFIVCFVVMIFDQFEVTQGRNKKVSGHVRNYRNEEIQKNRRYHEHGTDTQKVRKHINDTLECNARGGQCKSSCEESEEDTGSCCKEYRCCQPMTSCNDREDSTCRDTCNIKGDEYIDITLMCSDNTSCCRLCNKQSGGSFTGPMGSFFSPNYPSNYCNRQDCFYNITVEEGSNIMVIFLNVFLEDEGDGVLIYDGEIKPEALLYEINVDQADEIEVNSTSNKMIIHFTSDSSITNAGFRVNYKAI
ncbi:protein SpAN-like [Mytilus galloprovincialis]|uniref:protein SpAN-like n=1 Tax=Mytilus galloprovincialis TaxID=29158 RepID=UPI003F7BD2C3